MSEIKSIRAREILNSKGIPTVEVDVVTEEGIFRAAVPTGVSAGKNEAVELRDGEKRYEGKGVLKAVSSISSVLKPVLIGKNPVKQQEIDMKMIELDDTSDKSRLGANAILAVSLAVCRAGAAAKKMPLYKYIGFLAKNDSFVLPQPMILLIEGGKHGRWATDIQEFMIVPKKEIFPTFKERLRVGAEVFYALENILEEKDYSAGVGFEGAFCPREIKSNEEALELVVAAIEKAGYRPGEEVVLAIDAAASEFFKDNYYVLKSEGNKKMEPGEWIEKLAYWTERYPLWSIEDGFDEEDWQAWAKFVEKAGEKVQIVGDDLLTTNVKRIERAIKGKAVNSVLVKPNQIGTVTETLEAISISEKARFTTIVSHRGGETNDDFIADLVTGSLSWQSKFGAPNRGERIAKYNRLLRIEEEI